MSISFKHGRSSLVGDWCTGDGYLKVLSKNKPSYKADYGRLKHDGWIETTSSSYPEDRYTCFFKKKVDGKVEVEC